MDIFFRVPMHDEYILFTEFQLVHMVVWWNCNNLCWRLCPDSCNRRSGTRTHVYFINVDGIYICWRDVFGYIGYYYPTEHVMDVPVYSGSINMFWSCQYVLVDSFLDVSVCSDYPNVFWSSQSVLVVSVCYHRHDMIWSYYSMFWTSQDVQNRVMFLSPSMSC